MSFCLKHVSCCARRSSRSPSAVYPSTATRRWCRCTGPMSSTRRTQRSTSTRSNCSRAITIRPVLIRFSARVTWMRRFCGSDRWSCFRPEGNDSLVRRSIVNFRAIVRLIDWFVDWQIDRSFESSIVVFIVNRQIRWLIHWSIRCFVYSSIDWLHARPIDWLIDYLILPSMLDRLLDKTTEDEDRANPLRLPMPEMYVFAQPDGPQNLVLEDGPPVTRGVPLIKGATLVKLVERLTYHQYADPAFVKTFLITFRTFTTASRVLDLLIERFKIPLPTENGELSGSEDHNPSVSAKRFKKEYCQPVQFRWATRNYIPSSPLPPPENTH